jgi:hypothetical protein
MDALVRQELVNKLQLRFVVIDFATDLKPVAPVLETVELVE